MTDTSERIIILSAIILMFIAIQSYSELTGKRIVTLKDIEVEIYTTQDAYTLGENFTAIVYFVNNESEEVWVESVSQYTKHSYSLDHPEEGLSADVHVTIDRENPWMHIPANSRIKFDYMHCKPQYTGEFRISCLGAEKTVLILEPIVERADEKYNISREEAMDIAIVEAGSIGWVDIDAKISYISELLDDTPVEKYVWVVSLYRTPKEANSGSFLRVIVDPYNGTVLESELIAWSITP